MKYSYEELINRSNLCLTAAKKTKGKMQQIWIRKSEILKEKALDLPVRG